MNISDCLKDSNVTGIIQQESKNNSKPKIKLAETSSLMDASKESPEKILMEKAKDGMNIKTEDSFGQMKFLSSLENSDPRGNKDSKDQIKGFPIFKAKQINPQSKTIDQIDNKKTNQTTASIRSISPSGSTIQNPVNTISRTKTEETIINTIHSSSGGSGQVTGSRNRPNNSNSNERSKSKKKTKSKERNGQRPKTAKGQRKERLGPNATNKLFKNFCKKKKEDLNFHMNNGKINSLTANNSSSNTRAFPNGFWDRPSSVVDENRKTKISKFNESKERTKGKIKSGKGTRGGTPAPVTTGRQKQSNTVCGIHSSASQFIERSSSNECLRTNTKFNHHTQSKTRKGSAKKKNGSKLNVNIHGKPHSHVTKS